LGRLLVQHSCRPKLQSSAFIEAPDKSKTKSGFATHSITIADKLLRMNADASNSVVKLLDSGQQNFNSLANVASGVGANLNIAA
jgi:hypothetical protein